MRLCSNVINLLMYMLVTFMTDNSGLIAGRNASQYEQVKCYSI